MQRKLPQIQALDGIRGIAALMVMIFHFWQSGGLRGIKLLEKAPQFFILGQTGVDLFFVLSGFLITRILIATKNCPGFFTCFYARRVLRIFPLYYCFLILWNFLIPFFMGLPTPRLEQTWWYWFYLQNIPQTFPGLTALGPFHFWSLAIEEHFYLLWPLVVFHLPTRALPRVLYGIIGAAIAFRALFIYVLNVGVFYFTLCRMDALAFGALLACVEESGQLKSWSRVYIVVLVCAPLILGAIWIRVSGDGFPFVQLAKFTIIALTYFALLGAVVAYADARVCKIVFSNTLIKFIGSISYGLYVYHPICFYFAGLYVRQHNIMSLLSVSIGLTVFVSWISFTVLERPFLRMKRFVAYQ